MKILHINDYYYDLGGAEKYLFDICNAQEETGHEVSVIASSENGLAHSNGRKVYSVQTSYGLRSSLRAIGSLKKIMEKENPDIVHLHNVKLTGFLLIKYLCKTKPSVMTFHDIRYLCPGFRWKIIPDLDRVCYDSIGMRCFRNGCYPFCPDKNSFLYNIHKFMLDAYKLKILKNINRLIAPSYFIREQLVRSGFPEDNITVLQHYTGKTGAQRNGQGKHSPKTILYVGHVDEHKGITQFIKSLALLKGDNWQAEIIGEGRLMDHMRALVIKQGLDNMVSFLGRISGEEINKHYVNSSMVVIPSMVPESFGLVGIEAMSFGKPVIAYDAGGVKDWLAHNETGILVERGNIKMLSEAMNVLLSNEGLLVKMGRQAFEKVERKFRKKDHVDKLMNVYKAANGNSH